MGISHAIAITGAVLLAIGVALVMAFFRQIRKLEGEIEESRLREQKLIDKMLMRAGYSPVLEREQVVKIPDPEVKQPHFVEEAFRLDAIMEEVEQINPEMKGRDADYVQQLYPALWMEAEARFEGIHGKMRV